MKRVNYMLFLVLSMALCSMASAQTGVEGRWKTFDEETGKMKSIVELSIKNGKLYGKIVELNPDSDVNRVCTNCTDHRKGAKILGMQIISGLEKSGETWTGDDGILDPANGKLYDVKLWLEDGKLQVRGYIAFLYRTQVWVRA
jgi:uncharacterized protein (DUF2147 family)